MKRLLSLFLLCVFSVSLTSNAMEKTEVAVLTECLMCGEESPAEEFSALTTCHPDFKMCLGCCTNHIKRYIDNKNEDGVPTPEIPPCPGRDCVQKIDQDTVQIFFRNDHGMLERYNGFLFDKWKRDNGIKHCPTPDCEAEFESNIGERSHQCHACHQHYCPTCEFDHRNVTCNVAQATPRKCSDCNETHAPNITCEVAEQNRAQNINANTDDNVRKELDEKNMQKCPRCKVMLEKLNGCNYMTCANANCRYEFCWLCLGPGQGHRCINNNCGIWLPDHQALAQQLANIEIRIAGASRYERPGLEAQKVNIERQQAQIEEQRARQEQRQPHVQAPRVVPQVQQAAGYPWDQPGHWAQEDQFARQERQKRTIIMSAIGAAGSYMAYTIYQKWSQRNKFSLIVQKAEQTIEQILAIEFEVFDENNSLLALQEQFDIDSMLKFIKSDEKRDTLRLAIEAYDFSLKAVHDAISSAKYYHQTPEYFAKNEPKLVESLYTSLDTLKEAVSSCQSEISVNWKSSIAISACFGYVVAIGAMVLLI